jgi:hypothetical protein
LSLHKVVVLKVRSRAHTTSPDLTRPQVRVEGRLVQIQEGKPLIVLGPGQDRWETTPVQHIEVGARFTEVWTQNSVYKVVFTPRPRTS